MIRRTFLLSSAAALGCLASGTALADEVTVDMLLRGLEKNLNADSRTATNTMTVSNGRRVREYVIQSYGRGIDESALEFIAPARDKGTKMLRKGDDMWLYMPSVERTQKISGHMLRQGMMGSDMSYEDVTSSTNWAEVYNGTILGIESLAGRDHHRVELVAKTEDITYHKRVLWIDVETLIPTKQELYALSGLLVKSWEMSDVQETDGHKYPMKMRIEDKLKAGSFTEIHTTELSFEVDLPDEVFSMRWIERG
jgi:outer membrane lipoprotein-sorting protein